MKRTRLLWLLLAIVLISVTLSNSLAEETGKGYKVGLITNAIEGQYWTDIIDGLSGVIVQEGGTVDVFCCDMDISKFSRQVEDCISGKYDAIVFSCIDQAGVKPALDQCKEAGIPVFVYDKTTNEADLVVTQVQNSDFNMGFDLAGKLAEALDYKGKVLCVVNNNSASAKGRRDGVKACIEQYPDMELLIGEAQSMLAADVLPVVETMATTNPDIVGWVGFANTQTYAALTAFDTAGMKDVKIYSLGEIFADGPYLEDGRIDLVLSQEAYKTAAMVGQCILDYYAGKTLEPLYIVEHKFIDKDGLEEYRADMNTWWRR